MNTFSRSSASLLALSLALSVIACGGQVGDRNGSGDNNISSGGDAGSGGTGGNETGGVESAGGETGGDDPGGSNPGGSTGGSSRSGIALFRYQLDNLGSGGMGGMGTGGAGGAAGYAGGYDNGGDGTAGVGGSYGGTGGAGGTGGYYGGAAGVGGVGGSYGGSAGMGGYYGGSAGSYGGTGGYYGGAAGSYGGTGAGAVAGAGGAPQPQTLFLFVDSTPNHAATQCWAPYEALPCGAWRVTVGIDPQLIHPGISTFALSTPGIDAFFSSSGPGSDPNSCAGWGGGSFVDGSITLNFDGSSVLKGTFQGTNGIDFDANGDFEVSWCP